MGMNIAIALNEKFLRYGYVMLTSLFENNSKEEVSVTVLHRGIDDSRFEPYRLLAQRYNAAVTPMDITCDMIPGDLPNTDKWPIEVYFRLMLPFLLPVSVERLLYLDTDIIVDRSLKDLYEMDFDGSLIAAVPDNSDGKLSEKQMSIFSKIMDEVSDFHYVNSGVILMNISLLREFYTPLSFMETAEKLKSQITAFDQDLINYMFCGRIKYLPAEKYNLFARLFHNSGYDYSRVKNERTAIIHYTGPKPWSGTNLRTDMEKFWWDYAALTPYYHEFLEELVESEIETGFENTNEFRYQKYLQQNLQAEVDTLKTRETEYLKVIKESGELLKKLGT